MNENTFFAASSSMHSLPRLYLSLLTMFCRIVFMSAPTVLHSLVDGMSRVSP